MFKTPGLNNITAIRHYTTTAVRQQQPLLAIGFDDFLALDTPEREFLLEPILPSSSLIMLYAPRGLGKTFLSLSIGLCVSSGIDLLRWKAIKGKKRKVLLIDGEMTSLGLKERLVTLSDGLNCHPANFHILAADACDTSIDIGSEDGQRLIEPLLDGVELLIMDNLSTLCPGIAESSGDAWAPLQNWLLSLRRRGISVVIVHHAGVNGKARGSSRRQDALDVVLALRQPDDYSPEQGCRFECHIEKIRHLASDATAYEARLDGNSWVHCDLKAPLGECATELFQSGHSIRAVATKLSVSKSEAWRLRQISGVRVDSESEPAVN